MANTITHFIGTLMEVRPIQTKTKKNNDWIDIDKTELTVMFNGITEDGYLMPRVETVMLEEEDYDLFVDKKSLVVAIPFISIPHGDGFKFKFYSELPVLTFDKNPLDYSKYQRKNDSAKVVPTPPAK